MSAPKITFIGAGSTVFVKNILGDVFQRPALKSAHIALMDIDETRLEESHIVVRKLMDSVGANGEISCHRDRKTALQGADFVVVAFQIGGYELYRHRFCSLQAPRPGADHCRYAGAGRHYARAAHHPAPVGYLRRYERGLPGRHHA